MMSTFLRNGSMTFLCLFVLGNMYAQQKASYTDSIISYNFRENDTLNKTPYKLLMNAFDAKGRLIEQRFANWDRKRKSWNKVKMYSIHYYPTEMVVSKFTIENNKQEILAGRIIFSMDENYIHPLQIISASKARYKNQFDQLARVEFTYQNNKLAKKIEYTKGTQMFKRKETKYTYLPNLTKQNEKVYSELETAPIEVKTSLSYFKDSLIISLLENTEAHGQLRVKDTFVYDQGKLIRRDRKTILNTSELKANQLTENTRINYFYSKDGRLRKEILFWTSGTAEVLTNVEHEMKVYHYGKNLTLGGNWSFLYTQLTDWLAYID